MAHCLFVASLACPDDEDRILAMELSFLVAAALCVLVLGFGCKSTDKPDGGAGSGAGNGGSSGSSGASGDASLAGSSGGGVGGAAGASGVGGGGVGGVAGGGAGIGGSSGNGGNGGSAGSAPTDPCLGALVPANACKVCDNDSTCDAPTLTDNGNGTIGSSCCALTWQKGEAPDVYMWPDAESYCAALSLDGSGWRLPTKPELFTLVVKTNSPMIDTTKFPDAAGNLYWTSQADPKKTATSHWFVDFQPAVGGYADSSIGSPNAYVRCVR